MRCGGGEAEIAPGDDVISDSELAQAVDVVGKGRPGIREEPDRH